MFLVAFLGGSNIGLLMIFPQIVAPLGILAGLGISVALVTTLARKNAVSCVLLGLAIGILASLALCSPILDHFPWRGFAAVAAYGLAVTISTSAPAILARLVER